MKKEEQATIDQSSFYWEILLALIGFLLARVILLDSLQFMGLSYLVALFLHFKALKSLSVSSVFLGYLSTRTLSPLFFPFFLFILLARFFANLHPRRAFFLVNALSLLLYLLWSLLTVSPLNSFSHLFSLIVLYSLFSYIFLKALEALSSLMDGDALKETSLLLLSLLLFLPLFSFAGVDLKGLYLHALLGKTLLFFFSLYGGPTIGATTGAIWALSAFFISSSSIDPIFYPLLGLFCGLFKDLKELGLGLAFLLVSLGMAFLGEGGWAFDSHLLEGLLSLLLFCVVDAFYPLFLQKKRKGEERMMKEVKERQAREKRQEEKLKEYGCSLKELGDVFFYFNKEMILKGEDLPESILNNLVVEVCSTCQFHALCSGDALFYQGLLIPFLSTTRKGSPFPRSVMDERLKDCPYPHKIRAFLEKRLQEMEPGERKEEIVLMKELLSSLVRGLGEGMQGLEKEERMERECVFEYGLATSHGEEVSGDSYLIQKLPGGRELFGVSDGLGVGPKAARKSRHVMELIGKLLSLGMKEEEALHILNLLCLLSYRDDEYTTLDLAIFSPSSSRVVFYKYGAASTFIKRGMQVLSICSRSLPLGVYATRGRSIQRKLNEEDQVILITDGILEVCREVTIKEEWLIDVLKNLSHHCPQKLALAILKEAKKMSSSHLDDMTVLVIQQKREEIHRNNYLAREGIAMDL